MDSWPHLQGIDRPCHHYWLGPRSIRFTLVAAPFILGHACLLQYLFYQTSPLERLLKQFGWRTGSEITQEKVALKTLRGDFHQVPTIHKIEDRDAISRMEGEGGIADTEDGKIDVKVAIPQVIEASALPVKAGM